MKQEELPEIINAMRDVLNARLYVSEEVLASGRSTPPSASKASSLEPLTDLELEILKLQELRGDGPTIPDDGRRGQCPVHPNAAEIGIAIHERPGPLRCVLGGKVTN